MKKKNNEIEEKQTPKKSFAEVMGDIKKLVGSERERRVQKNNGKSNKGVLYLTEDHKVNSDSIDFESISSNDLLSLQLLIKTILDEELKRRGL